MDVSDMLQELTDHGFDSISTVRKLAVLNAAYQDTCAREPWPFLETLLRLTFSGTSYEPANPPTDMRAVWSMKLEGATGTGGCQVNYVRTDDYDNALGNNSVVATGTPVLFTIDGQKVLHFYPAPSATQVVRVRYLKRPAALVAGTLEADIVIPAEFQRDTIVNGALYRLYAMEDDTDISPTFETFYERTLENMREFCWNDQFARQDYIHPTSLDDLGIETIMPPFFTGA